MSVFLLLLVTFDEIKVLSSYVDGFLDMMKCMTCSDCIHDIISMRLKGDLNCRSACSDPHCSVDFVLLCNLIDIN